MIRFEDLAEKVRASNPDADIELLRRAYSLLGVRAQGAGAAFRRALPGASARSGGSARRYETGRRGNCRGPPPRHRRRHADADRSHQGTVRSGRRPRGRRGHEARRHLVFVERGAPGGELPQDAAGDGRRHPGHPGQARRSAAQHADAAPSAGRTADQDRAGDTRHLRADREPPRHEQGEERARGAGVQIPGAQGVRSTPLPASRAADAPPRG